ncbi:MAG: hypothetical protein J7L07_11450, partial [Candidatus Odinarchaeota archaeon]|nr:hypothetical protein [Candidatus Odinarchaeota archaeon]
MASLHEYIMLTRLLLFDYHLFIYYLLMAFSIVGFLMAIAQHRRRLSKILMINDPTELRKAKYLRQPYLALASFFSGLFFIAIYTILVVHQIPLELYIRWDIIYYYNYSSLYVDIAISLGIWIIYSAIMLSKIETLLDKLVYFWLGIPPVFSFWSILGFIYVSGLVVGPVLGFGFGLGLILLVLFFLILWISEPWMSEALFGIMLYACFLIGFPLSLNLLYGFIYGFMLWLGIGIGIGLALSEIIIYMNWYNAVGSILSRWILLEMKLTGGSVQIEKHESMHKISRDSEDYDFLKELLTNPFKQNEFIIKSKYFGALVSLDDSKFTEWEGKVKSTLDQLSKKGRLTLNEKEIAKAANLSKLQVRAVLLLSQDSKIKSYLSLYRIARELNINIDPRLENTRVRLFITSVIVPKSLQLISNRLGMRESQLRDLIELFKVGDPNAEKIARRFGIKITQDLVREAQRDPWNILSQIAVVDYTLVSSLIQKGYLGQVDKIKRVLDKSKQLLTEDLMYLWRTNMNAFLESLRKMEHVPLYVIIKILKEDIEIVNVLPRSMIKRIIKELFTNPLIDTNEKKLVLEGISRNEDLVVMILKDYELKKILDDTAVRKLVLSSNNTWYI